MLAMRIPSSLQELRVRAVGLNFRDVLNVMGSLAQSEVLLVLLVCAACMLPAFLPERYPFTPRRRGCSNKSRRHRRRSHSPTTSWYYYHQQHAFPPLLPPLPTQTVLQVQQRHWWFLNSFSWLREAFILEILALLVRTVQVQASAASFDLHWIEVESTTVQATGLLCPDTPRYRTFDRQRHFAYSLLGRLKTRHLSHSRSVTCASTLMR